MKKTWIMDPFNNSSGSASLFGKFEFFFFFGFQEYPNLKTVEICHGYYFGC